MVITGNGNYQYLPVITTPFFQLLPADLPRGKLPTPARGGAGGAAEEKGWKRGGKGDFGFLIEPLPPRHRHNGLRRLLALPVSATLWADTLCHVAPMWDKPPTASHCATSGRRPPSTPKRSAAGRPAASRCLSYAPERPPANTQPPLCATDVFYCKEQCSIVVNKFSAKG